jgi:ribonuclease-3
VRADVVSRRACAVVARDLDLGARLETEEKASAMLRTSSNVLAAVLESVLAVMFLEFGVEAIRGAVADAFQPEIEQSLAHGPDPKTRLQEFAATRGQKVVYETVLTDGPAHARVFTVAAVVDGAPQGNGVGRSKKDAAQEAARAALIELGADSPEAPPGDA